MEFIKKYHSTIGVILIGLFFIFLLKAKNDSLNNQLNVSLLNNKAITERYENAKTYEYELQLTINEYKNSNDSLIVRLQNAQKQLNIKDKELLQAQSINTDFIRVDTLILKDTIFVRDLYIDTTIGDKYINNHLILQYPSKIQIESNVKSEKDVFVSKTRETINPRSKWWICRIFQKKHDVIKIEVNENNPYIKSEENIFIRFIK